MRHKTVDIAYAKTHLSQLIVRVVRGERIVIARAGRAVAELRPVRRLKRRSIPLDDPLVRVHEYSYDGPIGPTTDRDVDKAVYDI